MPDIAKINAVAIADIEKLDSILAANIEKVNGLVFSTAPAIAAPAAAYSVRLLDTAVGVPTYTGAAMRVRRDTGTGGAEDDDEADIAFDSGVISLDSAISNASAGVTATTLGQFLNVGTVNGTTYTNPDSLTVTASCLVTEWMDQSGNANDASQATQGNQPQIHDGTVNTDLITENGNPVIKAQNGTIKLTTPLSTGVNDQTIFSVNRLDRTGVFWGTNDSSSVFFLAAESGSGSSSIQGGFSNVEMRKNLSTYSLTSKTRGNLFTDFQSQHLMTVEFDQSSSGTFQQLGYWTSPDTTFAMWSTQEVIIYASANKPSTTERTAIEENINNHFAIGNLPNPTSGLLATYTGAAAAYSVRQLANTAALSMRVREDATDTETNIGFDANGDLDTAAIATHCGSANGYVVTWYDQSGNSNHATQSTSIRQPLIYNGTTTYAVNGKPAIRIGYNAAGDDNLTRLNTGSNVAYQTNAATYISIVMLSDAASSQNNAFFGANAATGNDLAWLDAAGTWFWANGNRGSNLINASNTLTGWRNNQHLVTLEGTGSAMALYVDTTSEATKGSNTSTNGTFNEIFGIAQYYAQGYCQEFIVWPSDESSDRTGIETNIDTYFSIT